MRCLKTGFLICVFAFLSSLHFLGQPKLKIIYSRLGHLKKHEFFAGDALQYKLKGEHGFRSGRIVALHDSTIILNSDSLSVGDLRSIRINNSSYHGKLFGKIFLIGGIGYPLVSTFNNAMNDVEPLIDEKTAVISLSFLAASYICYHLGVKRIRLTNSKTIKIVDIDFEHLGR